MKTLDQEMIARLKKLAAEETIFDSEDEDVVIDDYAGGNVDDAYWRGTRDGETSLARDILVALGLLGEN
jgi:hypothetical protein